MKGFLWIVLVLGGTGWMSCGGGAVKQEESPADSQMVAEHVDPSTKFPQQLVATDTLPTDAQFVSNAMDRATETMALASLALQKSARGDVRSIAQGLLQDQQQLLSDLQKLRKQHKGRDSLKKYTDGSREDLEKLQGTAFDRQWVEKMVTWNAAGISRYEVASGGAKDKDTRALAAHVLPKLKTYQQQLETCRAKLQ